MKKNDDVKPRYENFPDSLQKQIEHTSLLIEYITICGLKQNDLKKYIQRIEEEKGDLIKAFQQKELEKNELFPTELGHYPPISKSKLPFPVCIATFSFPYGFDIIIKSNKEKSDGPEERIKSFSYIFTNQDVVHTYVSGLIIYEELEKYQKAFANTQKWTDPVERNNSILLKFQEDEPKDTSNINRLKQQENAPYCLKHIGSKAPLEERKATLPPERAALNSFPEICKKEDILVPYCIAIVSQYPMYQTFDKILRTIHQASTNVLEYPLEYYLSSIVCRIPYPPRGICKVLLQLNFPDVPDIEIEQTPMNELPTLDCDFQILVKSLSPQNVIKVIHGLLMNKHTIFIDIINDLMKV